MAVNDDLADDAIMRSIRALRAGNGVWADLLEVLRQVERDLIERLEREGAPRSVASVRAQRLLRAIREIIEGGREELADRLEAIAPRLITAEEAAAYRSLLDRVPIAQGEWVRPSASLLEAIATTAPFQGALLRDHLDQWSRTTIFRMQQQLRIAIIEGEGIEPMRRRLERVAEISTKDARAIARTYTAHVTNEARARLYEANSDVIASEQWVATLDTRTCPSCGALDNQVYPIGRGPRPPLHINCRCVRVPITRAAAALEARGVRISRTRTARGENGLTGEVPADMAFPEWLRRQSRARQDEVLGKTRAEMFRNGTRFDRFVDDEGNVIPLDDL